MLDLPEDDGSQILEKINLVLRDSLGYLAVQILCQRDDFKAMNYDIMLHELESIISDLHGAYQRQSF